MSYKRGEPKRLGKGRLRGEPGLTSTSGLAAPQVVVRGRGLDAIHLVRYGVPSGTHDLPSNAYVDQGRKTTQSQSCVSSTEHTTIGPELSKVDVRH